LLTENHLLQDIPVSDGMQCNTYEQTSFRDKTNFSILGKEGGRWGTVGGASPYLYKADFLEPNLCAIVIRAASVPTLAITTDIHHYQPDLQPYPPDILCFHSNQVYHPNSIQHRLKKLAQTST
jgi:hypothetical protein